MSLYPAQCLASVDFKGQGIVCTFAQFHVLPVHMASEMGVQREDGKLKHTHYCHAARGEVCFAVVGLC